MKINHFKNKGISDIIWATDSNNVLFDGKNLFNSLLFPEEVDEIILAKNLTDSSSEFIKIGKQFEQLITSYFTWSQQWEIVLQNLQVIDRKKTIGEIDFIVKNLLDRKHYHIEVAVKFYLGTSDLSDPSNWIGPNVTDNLKLKLDKLNTHQLLLSQHPSLKEKFNLLGIETITPSVWMKGILFRHKNELNSILPDSISSSPTIGYWIYQKEVHLLSEEEGLWKILDRKEWIGTSTVSKENAQQLFSSEELINHIQQIQSLKSLMLSKMVLSGNYYIEEERWMIIYNHWPQPFFQTNRLTQ